MLDSFFGFTEALGLTSRRLEWNLPLPPEALDSRRAWLPDRQPTLVVSPCSSHARRNWSEERYAAVIRHAVQRHGMRVILCGAPTAYEREFAARVASSRRGAAAELRSARTRCRSCWRCSRAPACC